jgi:hypothetical protein
MRAELKPLLDFLARATATAQFVRAVEGHPHPTDCCIYCGSNGRFQLDHFPVPHALGGRQTVRACLHCHNMKDRVSEAIAMDWFGSNIDACDDVILCEAEVAFLFGRASILPRQAAYLVDDLSCYPASMRVVIARRLRDQIFQMMTPGNRGKSCS